MVLVLVWVVVGVVVVVVVVLSVVLVLLVVLALAERVLVFGRVGRGWQGRGLVLVGQHRSRPELTATTR